MDWKISKKCGEQFNYHCLTERCFFFRIAICFSNIQKQLLQITSKNLNKLFTVMGGNFKFQAQDSDLD